MKQTMLLRFCWLVLLTALVGWSCELPREAFQPTASVTLRWTLVEGDNPEDDLPPAMPHLSPEHHQSQCEERGESVTVFVDAGSDGEQLAQGDDISVEVNEVQDPTQSQYCYFGASFQTSPGEHNFAVQVSEAGAELYSESCDAFVLGGADLVDAPSLALLVHFANDAGAGCCAGHDIISDLAPYPPNC